MQIRRRRLIALLGVVVVAAAAVVVGGAFAGGGADERGARVVRYTIDSKLTSETLRQVMILPAGWTAADDRPLLVMLHGRGEGGERGFLRTEFFRALERQGARAPVVVFPSGGDHSYWHDRKDGRWGAYVIKEVIPRAVQRGHADGTRVAIGGVSMGGFGALDLARLHPTRFCAVGAHSPALWQSGGETAAGAFDDAADFGRHDVVGVARSAPKRFAGQPLWLDIGDRDPFVPGADAFLAALRTGGVRISAHRWKGGHDAAYWKAHYGAWLDFYVRSCAR